MKMKIILVSLGVILLSILAFFMWKGFGGSAETTADAATLEIEEQPREAYEQPDQKDVPFFTKIKTTQNWEFSFDHALLESSVTKENITIMDEHDNHVDLAISLLNDNKTLNIAPASGSYKSGTTYTLNIQGLQYEDNTPVEYPYEMVFVTERDEVEVGIVSEAVTSIEESEIKSVEGNTVQLAKNSDFHIKEGDILLLPIDGEEEFAVKVESIIEHKNYYELTLVKPYVAEIFRELDIYKTYDIVAEHLDFIEEEGLNVENIALAQNNTQIASTNASAQNGPYQLPKTKLDVTNGIKFSFENFQVGTGKDVVTLNGTLHAKQPRVDVDVKLGLGTIERMSLITKTELVSEVKVKKKGGESKPGKKALLNKPITIPSNVPGVALNVQFYLYVDLKTSAEPEIFLTFEVEQQKGFYSDGDTVQPVNNSSASMNMQYNGKGKAELKLGPSVSVWLSAYKVVGAGAEVFGGPKGSGEAVMGTSERNGAFACMKATGNPTVEGHLFVELHNPLTKKVNRVVEIKALEVKLPPKLDLNTCEAFDSIQLNMEKITVTEPGPIHLTYSGRYIDLSTSTQKIKPLGQMSNFNVTSSNDQVFTVEEVTDKKIVIKAADTPADLNALLVIEYEEKSIFAAPLKWKMEIEVTLSESLLVKEPEKPNVNALLANFQDITTRIYRLADERGWQANREEPNYDLIMERIDHLVTSAFGEKLIRPALDELTTPSHHSIVPSNVEPVIRKQLRMVNEEKLELTTVQLANHYGGGGTVTLTAVWEKDKWLIDDVKLVSYSDRSLQLTWEEMERYFQSRAMKVKRVMEVTEYVEVGYRPVTYEPIYGKAKVYYFEHTNGESDYPLLKVESHNGFILDYPMSYLEQLTGSQLDGTYTHDYGRLIIANSTSTSFDFDIHVSTTHVGEIGGRATRNGNSATFVTEGFNNSFQLVRNGCTISFELSSDAVDVTESFGCSYYHGAGIHFDGIYRR